MKNTLAALHNREFIAAHQLLAEFLIVRAAAWTAASGIRGVEGIDRFLAERFGEFFQRGRFGAA